MKRKIAAVFSLISMSASACFVSPAEQTISPSELLKRTNNIILAKVISATASMGTVEVEYTFQTIKVFKGKHVDNFKISGRPLFEGWMQNFNHHNDEVFWENKGGRHLNSPDCKIYPRFTAGATFLIFLDGPYHRKSFENIIRTHGDKQTKDKWLQYVEEHTDNKPEAEPEPEPDQKNTQPHTQQIEMRNWVYKKGLDPSYSPSMATKEDDKLIKLFIEIYRFRSQNPEFNELSFDKILQDKDKHYKFYLFNIKHVRHDIVVFKVNNSNKLLDNFVISTSFH
jgi:hypothetical protein